MEFKGTQGEWTFSGQSGVPGHCYVAQVWDADGSSLAQVEPTEDPAIATANARLIAAAPELLQALIYAVNFGSKGEIDDDGPHQGMSVSFFTESAIKKALGESS